MSKYLLRAKEFAARLGWSPNKFATYKGRGLLPRPAVEDETGEAALWRPEQVEEYKATLAAQMKPMGREAMVAYLDRKIVELDERIRAECATVGAAPIERTVSRNTILVGLADTIAKRAEFIRDMGDLIYGQRDPREFPGYQLFAEMEETADEGPSQG